MRPRYHDIAVVGAGVLGCATAHRLAQRFGNMNIALIDRGRIGQGCSGSAGALSTPTVGQAALRARSDYARGWYLDYMHTDRAAPLRLLPMIYVGATDRYNELVERIGQPLHPLAAGTGPHWMRVPADDSAWAGATAIWADVARLCERWVAQSASVVRYEGSPVTAWEPEGQGWTLHFADGRALHVGRLIMARGPWTAAREGVDTPAVRTKRVTSWRLALRAGDDDAAMYFTDERAFLLPLPARGEWWLSITSNGWDCAPESSDARATADDLALAHRVLERYAPSLVDTVRGSSVHVDAYSADGVPFVHRCEDGRMIAAGGSGSGFRYAPAVARDVIGHVANEVGA